MPTMNQKTENINKARDMAEYFKEQGYVPPREKFRVTDIEKITGMPKNLTDQQRVALMFGTHVNNEGGDYDGVIGESIDIAQSGLAKLGADAFNALEKGAEALIGKENVDAYNDWADRVTKFFGGKEAGIVMDREGNFRSENILGLEGNIKDSRNRLVADEKFGVKKSTRAEQQALNQAAEESIAKGDYLGAVGSLSKLTLHAR